MFRMAILEDNKLQKILGLRATLCYTGWGKAEINLSDDSNHFEENNFYLEYYVECSVESEVWGISTSPVCVLNAGDYIYILFKD
jgi:hypothetical protein